jgi:molybdenum cofactor cytidylyltransferase
VNDDYAAGLSTSLKLGISALPAGVAGALMVLGDQPFVTAAHLDALSDAAARNVGRIVAATFGGRRASPTYFPRGFFAELLAVTGDIGGREVIGRHRDHVASLELDDPVAALDIDTPTEYERASAIWAQRHP